MILNHAPILGSSTFHKAACLCVLGAALLMAGCKGNTSAAALPEPVVGNPPTVHANKTSEDMRDADPLTSMAWKKATWWTLAPPINVLATTPQTRGAVLYDSANIYVAFVNQKPAVVTSEITDTVSLYLDPKNEGKELLQILATEAGAPKGTWFRATSRATPREDGSPNMAFPVDRLPDVALHDVWCVVREGQENGTRLWSTVFGVPVKGLPGPLQSTLGPGAHWKVNLVRTVVTTISGRRVEQLQSNLSPVFMDAQAVSPYRMAELEFGE